MAKRIVVANQKGGVGKTFIVVLFAFLLAMLGKRVLVVDMDPQGNSTRRLGAKRTGVRTMFDILDSTSGSVVLGAVGTILQPCGWEGFENHIKVAGANSTLSALEQQSGLPGALNALDDALNGLDDMFDFILIDTQRTEGHVTRVAYTAAERLVLVTEPEQDAVESAASVYAYIQQYQRHFPRLKLAGVITNRKRTGVKFQAAYDMATVFPPDLAWEPALPVEASIGSTMSMGLPPASDSRIARSLAPDLLNRLMEACRG